MKGRHLKALIPSMCVSLLVGMMPAVDSYAAGASYFYACAYDDCYIYEEADQNSIKIAVYDTLNLPKKSVRIP